MAGRHVGGWLGGRSGASPAAWEPRDSRTAGGEQSTHAAQRSQCYTAGHSPGTHAHRDGGRDARAGGDQVRDRGRPGVPRAQLGQQLNYTTATPKQLSMGECDN